MKIISVQLRVRFQEREPISDSAKHLDFLPSLLEGRRSSQLSYADSPDSKDFAPSRFLPKLWIPTTGGGGADSRYIFQAPSRRSRFTGPAASPAPRIDDVWRASIGFGVAGWLMTAIADDAHLSRPLLPVTSSAIFVNN
jgi:hypothetical protein